MDIAGTDLRRQWRAAIAPLRQDVATWLIRLPGRELGRVGILGSLKVDKLRAAGPVPLPDGHPPFADDSTLNHPSTSNLSCSSSSSRSIALILARCMHPCRRGRPIAPSAVGGRRWGERGRRPGGRDCVDGDEPPWPRMWRGRSSAADL